MLGKPLGLNLDLAEEYAPVPSSFLPASDREPVHSWEVGRQRAIRPALTQGLGRPGPDAYDAADQLRSGLRPIVSRSVDTVPPGPFRCCGLCCFTCCHDLVSPHSDLRSLRTPSARRFIPRLDGTKCRCTALRLPRTNRVAVLTRAGRSQRTSSSPSDDCHCGSGRRYHPAARGTGRHPVKTVIGAPNCPISRTGHEAGFRERRSCGV